MTRRSYVQYNTQLEEMDTVMNAQSPTICAPDTLVYRSNQFLMLRPELVQICDCDAIEAFILRIVETKMQQGLEWVTLSYRQIKDALYRIVNSENTIIAKLTDLLVKGFLKRRPNPDRPHAAPQYRIDIPATQKALNAITSVFEGGVPIIGTGKDMGEEIPVPEIGTGGYQKLVRGVPEIGTGEYQELVPILDRDITKKIKEKDITFTIVNGDELAPYIDGYPDQSQVVLLEWIEQETNKRFSDIPPSLPLTPAQEAKLYTEDIHSVDNETVYPIASPKATRKPRKPKAEPPPAPSIQLTEQQQAFWLLWCDIWFNQDIPPELNDTAYKHVKKLAPLVKTKEQLEDLIKHARVEMEASGFKRKVVHLGNLVNSYPGWKQQSRPISSGTPTPQNFTGMGKLLHTHQQEARRGQTFTA